uniref:Uncharacterized protein n=1 Tax=Parascaris univalens TaxID=6257 RepID=A0A915A3H5_PARUN
MRCPNHFDPFATYECFLALILYSRRCVSFFTLCVGKFVLRLFFLYIYRICVYVLRFSLKLVYVVAVHETVKCDGANCAFCRNRRTFTPYDIRALNNNLGQHYPSLCFMRYTRCC